MSLGIETLGGVCTKLIERNTTIPVKKSQVFSTAADNQTAVDIHILQGEREFARDNKTLGNFQLSGIAPAPRGIPQIEVTFDIDANGIVNVSAKDLGTGTTQNITITASTNLSEEEINKAVNEAKQYEEEDKKRKEVIDSHNKLDGMIFTVEKSIKDLGDKVSEEDKAKLEEEIKLAKTELETNDKEKMDTAFDNLSKVSQEVFAKVYQQAQANGENPNANGGDTEFHQGGEQ